MCLFTFQFYICVCLLFDLTFVFVYFSGCHQLYGDAEHDVHENVAEVRPVVGRQGQHGLRTRIQLGGRTQQGK